MLRQLLLFLILPHCGLAQKTNIANYDIDVQLFPESKRLDGKQVLYWTNTTPYPTRELHFHTYLNAFKDSESTFMRGSGGKLRNDAMDTKNKANFGHIRIKKALLSDGKPLLGEFIQPDNLNTLDQTVLRYSLEKPVLPGEKITIIMEFEAQLPKVFARTGWSEGEYFLVGQWFPKIGVLEQDGTWNCHQFHANTEFYADFGQYRVNITLPERFVVGGSGKKIAEVKAKNGTKTVSFHAYKVHDFAWTASPHFVEIEETYMGVRLVALMQKENAYLAKRYLDPVKKAMKFLNQRIGEYPYSTLTMVDPAWDGSGSGGMEYPTLITCGALWGLGKWMRYPELVTIHEFVHQYFQGMLASNEFENSWMDEGFTQYLEGRIMDEYYPKGALLSLGNLHLRDADISRIDYVSMPAPTIAPMRMDAWKYPVGTYSVLSYTKPATVLQTLENLVGSATMDKILKTYFENYKFSHPKPENFIQVATSVTRNKQIETFLHQAILGAEACDYRISELKNSPKGGEFRISNMGGLNVPVNVKILFENGKTQQFTWEGDMRFLKFAEKISAVEIDPERKNRMDLNLLNNSRAVEAPKAVGFLLASQVVFWLQQLLVWA
jgi:hypothetical protein